MNCLEMFELKCVLRSDGEMEKVGSSARCRCWMMVAGKHSYDVEAVGGWMYKQACLSLSVCTASFVSHFGNSAYARCACW
jgi:hypothetical protein